MIHDYEQLYIDEKNKNIRLEKERQYLLSKVKILQNTQNKGEKDEVLLLIELFHFNQTAQYNKLVDIFGEEASEGISILDMNTKDEIVDVDIMSKAKCGFKADCMIRMKKTQNIYCISIKSKNGANPAILNHTPRNAKIFREGGVLYDNISWLDKILEDYIDKRNNNVIGEDTSITNLASLNDPFVKNKFMEVLTYFVFEGSGKGDSKCKANAIMTYQDDVITFVKCVSMEEKKEYIQTIYDTIILSLRDKGMPTVMTEYCKPWVFIQNKSDGVIKYKGSLHIRMK